MHTLEKKSTNESAIKQSTLLDPRKKGVESSEVSAFRFLDFMKKAVHGIIGTGDYTNSGFRNSDIGGTRDFANSAYSMTTSDKTGAKVVKLHSPIGRHIIRTTSARDSVTNAILSATKIPRAIILQEGINDDVKYDKFGHPITHDQIPYTPIKIEMDPRYKGSVIMTLEKDVGTRRQIQLMIPLRETYELSFDKKEMKELELERRTGGGNVYLDGKKINEIDLLQYGRHFVEMEAGEYYLHTGDAIQSMEFRDGKVIRSSHEIIAMSTTTKSVPAYGVTPGNTQSTYQSKTTSHTK